MQILSILCQIYVLFMSSGKSFLWQSPLPGHIYIQLLSCSPLHLLNQMQQLIRAETTANVLSSRMLFTPSASIAIVDSHLTLQYPRIKPYTNCFWSFVRSYVCSICSSIHLDLCLFLNLLIVNQQCFAISYRRDIEVSHALVQSLR